MAQVWEPTFTENSENMKTVPSEIVQYATTGFRTSPSHKKNLSLATESLADYGLNSAPIVWNIQKSSYIYKMPDLTSGIY